MPIGQPSPRSAFAPCASLLLLSLLGACGGSGGGGDGTAGVPSIADAPAAGSPPAGSVPVGPAPEDAMPSLPSDDGTAPLEIAPDDSMLERAGITALGDDPGRDDPVSGGGDGRLIPRVFESGVGTDLRVAEGLVALVELLDASLILPRDVPVNVIDCGTANAFYATDATEAGFPGPNIFLCHELVQDFVGFYNADPESVFLASAFVLVHELGHALVHQLELPVLGIEESYVDGIAAVFAGEGGMAEAPLLAGFFFLAQPDSPWFDTHRVGRQRFGDLACWAIGAEPALTEDPEVSDIADQLVASGRDCVAAYRQQLDGLTQVLDPHVRGELGAAFASASLPDGIATSGEDGMIVPPGDGLGVGPGIGSGSADAVAIASWDVSTMDGNVRFVVLVDGGPDAGAYILDFRGDAVDRGEDCYRFERAPFAFERFAVGAGNRLLLDGEPVGRPIVEARVPQAPLCGAASTSG